MQILVLGMLAVLAQTGREPPAFRSGVDAVKIAVSIGAKLDRQLTMADVEVFEDGHPQQVTYFSPEPMPMDIILLLDTSGSVGPYGPATLETSMRLVEVLGRTDRMQVMRFAADVVYNQDFTGDRQLLKHTLESGPVPNNEGTVLWRALTDTLTLFATMGNDTDCPRRKVLVVVTDGVNNSEGAINAEGLTALAQRAQASVYIAALPALEPIGAPPNFERLKEDGRYALKRLCQETGGLFLEASSPADARRLWKAIEQDVSSQYTLGWQSDSPPERTARTIQVRIRGVRSEKLRYRSLYIAHYVF